MNIEEKSLRNLSKESMTHGLKIHTKPKPFNKRLAKTGKRKSQPKSNERINKTANYTLNSGGKGKISSLYNRVKVPIRQLNFEHPYNNNFGSKNLNNSMNTSNYNKTPDNKNLMNASFTK